MKSIWKKVCAEEGLLNSIGVGGLFPLDIQLIELSAIEGQSLVLLDSDFQVPDFDITVSGNLQPTVFDDLPIQPTFEAGSDELLPAVVLGLFSRSISFTDPGSDGWFGTVE